MKNNEITTKRKSFIFGRLSIVLTIVGIICFSLCSCNNGANDQSFSNALDDFNYFIDTLISDTEAIDSNSVFSDNTENTLAIDTPTSESYETLSVVSDTTEKIIETIEAPKSDGFSAEFKDAMDSYESFMNKYVAFMKKYKKNPTDFTLISEYAKYITDYAEFCVDFAEWENAELNTEEMKYYIEVQTRVSKRLLEVAD